MFDLEKEIKKWKRSLKKYEIFENGYITELESHLRDEIDSLTNQGKSQEEAFQEASEKIGDPENIGTEFFKAHTRHWTGLPPWQTSNNILSFFIHYCRTFLRNVKKYKTYSIINISGLVIGIASVLLIWLYLSDELSFDRYHRNADRIFRVSKSSEGAEIPNFVGTPPPLGPALKNQFPGVEDFVRFDPVLFRNKILFTYGEKSFYEERFFLADPNLFEVFDFQLIRGDPHTVLANPTNIVLSETTADKYFGDENPLGKVINYDGKFDLTVTGIMEDVPYNSHFKFELVGSFEFVNEIFGSAGRFDVLTKWGYSNFYTYVLLKNNVDSNELEKKSSSFIGEITKNPQTSIYFQPLTDIHLRSKIKADPEPHGNIMNVYLYSAIAVVILLMACINFMNLSTANSETRAKEIGLKKVIGAGKKQLVFQILSESVIQSLCALPLAVILLELALPRFNQMTGKELDIIYSKDFILFAEFLVMTILVGLISGIYPAFFIASFKPVKIIRGKINYGIKRFTFRNILVIFQFTISVILIIGSFVINTQMKFIRNKKLGYDRENIINIPLYSSETKAKYELFRNAILGNSDIIDATATSFTPSIERWHEGMYFEGKKETDNHSFYRMAGDFNLIDLFGIEIIAGRTFNRSIPTDLLHSYILNESAVRSIGWTPEEAVGKLFGSNEGKVIGVARDFNFRSLRFETQPLVMNVFPRMFQYVSIKIKPGDIPNTINYLRNSWEKTNPGFPFEYYFYDDEFDKLYKADMKLENLFEYFTFLAIFISCMGLFGLVSYITRRRTKEIGVRKVLGAPVQKLLFLLFKDFTVLILIGFLIASPLAYFVMDNWLQDFAYKTNISIVTILLSGLVVLSVALATVSCQIIKVTLTNPVKILKYE